MLKYIIYNKKGGVKMNQPKITFVKTCENSKDNTKEIERMLEGLSDVENGNVMTLQELRVDVATWK